MTVASPVLARIHEAITNHRAIILYRRETEKQAHQRQAYAQGLIVQYGLPAVARVMRVNGSYRVYVLPFDEDGLGI